MPAAIAPADDPIVLALLRGMSTAGLGLVQRTPVEWLRLLASHDIEAAGLYVLTAWAPVRVLADAPKMFGFATEVAQRESFALPGLDVFVTRIESLARDYGDEPLLARPFETLTAQHDALLALLHMALVTKEPRAIEHYRLLLRYMGRSDYSRRWMSVSTQQARLLVFLSHNAESLARAARQYNSSGDETKARYASLARVTVLQLMRLLSSSSLHETGLAMVAFEQQRRSWEGSILLQSMLNAGLQEIFDTSRCVVFEHEVPAIGGTYTMVNVSCPP